MKIKLANKQRCSRPTSRHGVTFSMFSLSTANLSRILQGEKRTAVDEANKMDILTVRLARCQMDILTVRLARCQIAATCMENGTMYTDRSCVPNVT
jgi:hypothetical protein